MARKVKELQDLEIDEISLVDKGANQHARTVIAKRHDEEEEMDKYFDENGEAIDVASLEPGDVIYDEEGNAYAAELEESEEDELEPVGKSDFYSVEDFREELSKAMSDDARDEIISKAFGQIESLQHSANQSAIIAEGERQLRLQREYTEVAKNYDVGVSAEDLGPVLMRVAETLNEADQRVIAKALDSASTANARLFDEIGTSGSGSNSDTFNSVEEYVSKALESDAENTRESLVSKAFEMDPAKYDQYLAEQNNR